MSNSWMIYFFLSVLLLATATAVALFFVLLKSEGVFRRLSLRRARTRPRRPLFLPRVHRLKKRKLHPDEEAAILRARDSFQRQ